MCVPGELRLAGVVAPQTAIYRCLSSQMWKWTRTFRALLSLFLSLELHSGSSEEGSKFILDPPLDTTVKKPSHHEVSRPAA